MLRQRMMLGALSFGCFSALWTSIAFLLAGPPYNYGNAFIGLFGLAGIAGALAASIAGRLADRGLGQLTSVAAIVVLLVSWGVLAAGRSSLAPLILGIALLDFASQALHISNQSAIYALRPEARSRLTTAYMVSCFLGASAVLGAELDAVRERWLGRRLPAGRGDRGGHAGRVGRDDARAALVERSGGARSGRVGWPSVLRSGGRMITAVSARSAS